MVFGRIHELELYDLCQKNMPVRIKPEKKAFPVKVLPFFQPDVVHIGAIVTFPVLHEDLAPDKFFGGKEEHIHPYKPALVRMEQPAVVHAANIVDRVKNDIDKI